ncbi:hypothetical protein [Poseidonocella pacifica]|uniref:Abi-alpha family protein n=1 Tax=Poseidonocella pacifica TaxID=871651 RepID=UPI0011134A3D|nr:hypothetical protein [Poseidonocella pacifica]
MTDKETIRAISEASKEIAKTTGKAFELAASFGQFLHRVVGEPVEVASSTFLTDPLKEYKVRRLHRLQIRTEEILSSKAIHETLSVSPKLANRIFEQASIEDTDEIHDFYAKLLSESMIPGGEDVDIRFISAVREFTPECARMVKYIYQNRYGGQDHTLGEKEIEKRFDEESWRPFRRSEFVREGFDVSHADYLVRLGILEYPHGPVANPEVVSRQRHPEIEVVFRVPPDNTDRDTFDVADFGRKLISALESP